MLETDRDQTYRPQTRKMAGWHTRVGREKMVPNGQRQRYMEGKKRGIRPEVDNKQWLTMTIEKEKKEKEDTQYLESDTIKI